MILTAFAVALAVGSVLSSRASVITHDVSLSLNMLALVVCWLGAFVFCFGGRIFRACAFPLLFLFWLVPIPTFALSQIVNFLQVGSASAARVLLTIAQVPVSQDNTILRIPGLTIEVAQECSSIRSSLLLVVTAMLTAHLFLRTLWGKTAVSLAAIPLAIAKNGLRIFTLSALSVYVDPGYLSGRLHHQGGILFFLTSLLALVVLLWLVRWIERHTARGTGGMRSALILAFLDPQKHKA
jgi:exosortase